MEINNEPGGLPNFFYDIIVFLIPTFLFSIGFVVGMNWEAGVLGCIASGNIEGWHTFWLVSALLLASYEYGRLAETFSDIFVGEPLRFLHRKKFLFHNKDFCRDLSIECAHLRSGKPKIGPRGGSKWAVYIFALVFTPALGTDLLKRYAWEKLARSSAFSCALLAAASICWTGLYLMFDREAVKDVWHFGGSVYTALALISYIILSIDYYKRNAWNNDLLVTAIPVLLRAAKSHEIHSETETPTS